VHRILAVIGAAILAVTITAVYRGALEAPFFFDDGSAVLENPSIEHLWPLFGDAEHPGPLNPPAGLPTSSRPLVNFTFALNYFFGRFEPRGYHALNLALHVIAALLLWAIVRRTLLLDYFQGRFNSSAGPLAFASAMIWALHPLASETVVYVTQRTELLMGCCYLATFYGALRYWSAMQSRERAVWLVVSSLACVAGMLSKEMMVSAPVMALLYERTFITGSFRRALGESWPLYLGLALGWIPLVVINFEGPRIPLAGFHLGVPADAWWFTQAKVLFLYLKLTFWPWPLVIHYEIPYLKTASAAWPWLLAAGVAAVATLWLVWRRTAAGFVLCCAVAILSPTLVVPLRTEVAAERRMYAPLAAIVPLLIVGAYAFARRFEENAARRRGYAPTGRKSIVIVTVAVTMMAVGFGKLTMRRLSVFGDELTLWLDAQKYQPNDPLIQINIGVYLEKSGDLPEAIKHFERAVELDPDFFHARYNLARALDLAGHSDEATEQYRETLRLEPDDAPAPNNLGILLANAGQTDEAIALYERAITLVPHFAAAHVNLGVALAARGEIEKAIPHFEQASRHKQTPETYTNLMSAYAQVGRRADAVAAARKALALARAQDQPQLVAQIEAWLTAYRESDDRQ